MTMAKKYTFYIVLIDLVDSLRPSQQIRVMSSRSVYLITILLEDLVQ